MEWYGPDEVWPQHGRDYYRDALSYARKADWWLQKYSSHSFGKVVCDRNLPGDARCEFLVFSSGAGAENKARELRSLVDRCPHKSSTRAQGSSAVDAVAGLLDEADLLVAAAQRCIEADDMQARAQELLDLAAEAAATADSLLDDGEAELEHAVELDSRSRDERAVAAELADAAGYSASARVGAEPLLDEATERVVTAKRRLGPPSHGGRRRMQLRERAERVLAKIRATRGQLGS